MGEVTKIADGAGLLICCRHSFDISGLRFWPYPSTAFKMMNVFSKIFTPRNVNTAKSMAYPAAVYGAGGGLLALYFTSEWIGEWVLGYVPIYNDKYKEKPKAM